MNLEIQIPIFKNVVKINFLDGYIIGFVAPGPAEESFIKVTTKFDGIIYVNKLQIISMKEFGGNDG
jgi:hypothetical protein